VSSTSVRVSWSRFSQFIEGADRLEAVRNAWENQAHPHSARSDEGPQTLAAALARLWSALPCRTRPTDPSLHIEGDGNFLDRACAWADRHRLADATSDSGTVRVGAVTIEIRPTVAVTIEHSPFLLFVHTGAGQLPEHSARALLELLTYRARERGRDECPAVLDVMRGELLTDLSPTDSEEGVERAAHRFAAMWKRFDQLASRLNIYSYLPSGTDVPGWDLSQIDWSSARVVLDVGCGAGRHLSRLREMNLRVYGVDPSFGAVRHATTGGSGPYRDCAVGDLMDLPIADDSVDVVLAMHMLYNLPDLHRGLREVRRVLRSRGQLLAATSHPRHLQEFDEVFRTAVRTVSGSSWGPPSRAGNRVRRFDLANAPAHLRQIFQSVERRQLMLPLVIENSEAVTRYIYSTRGWREPDLPSGTAWGDVMDEVSRLVSETVRRDGAFRTTFHEGVMVCR
jgi:SAM-dependent methyltransferase